MQGRITQVPLRSTRAWDADVIWAAIHESSTLLSLSHRLPRSSLRGRPQIGISCPYISSRRFGHGPSRHVVPSGGRDCLHYRRNSSRCIPGTFDFSQHPAAQHVQRIYPRLHVQGCRGPLRTERSRRTGQAGDGTCQPCRRSCPRPGQ